MPEMTMWYKHLLSLPFARRAASTRRRLMLNKLEDRCTPAAVSWDGGAATLNWSDANNWNPDGLPGAADDVTIDVAGTITVQHTGGATTIKSLQLQENLTVSGGPLVVSGNLAVNSGNTLRTTGSGASFTAMGATTADGASILALNSST